MQTIGTMGTVWPMQQPRKHTAKYARMKIMTIDQVIVESVASLIWWNAGSNDPEVLKKLQGKRYTFAGTMEPVPPPSWEKVQNKDMWRRMAVAAIKALNTVKLPIGEVKELTSKYNVRIDVPK